MTDSLHVELRDGVLEVMLDRPKANAIDAATSRRMGEIFIAFRDDPAQRVAILTGAGAKFFSAGWDLKSAAEGEGLEVDHGPGGFAGLTQLFDLDKPVIAAVNGLAVGGGFELALCCDLMVAAEHAAFFLPETRVGVAPDAGCFRLPERLPRAIALEMLLTGRRMAAEEAARWGLVNAVVPGDQLMGKARALAQEIAVGAPLAVAAVKELVRAREAADLAECYRRQAAGELTGYARMAASEDAEEGPRAFAEKRDPVWRRALGRRAEFNDSPLRKFVELVAVGDGRATLASLISDDAILRSLPAWMVRQRAADCTGARAAARRSCGKAVKTKWLDTNRSSNSEDSRHKPLKWQGLRVRRIGQVARVYTPLLFF